MLVPFDTLPSQARLWIYQSNRVLSDTELGELKKRVEPFLISWTAHRQDLKASYQILDNCFIMLAVDESNQGATGCSIDASVHFLQEVERDLQVKLLDRAQIAYRQGSQLGFASMRSLKEKVKAGDLASDTKIYNNSVIQLGQLKDSWEQKLEESWLARYLPANSN